MTAIRLTSESWITAYRRHLEIESIPFYILKKGNSSSGSILVKVLMAEDFAKVYHNIMDVNGLSKWDILFEGSQAEVDHKLERQGYFDNDLWLLEVEEKSGIGLLDRDSLKRG